MPYGKPLHSHSKHTSEVTDMSRMCSPAAHASSPYTATTSV
ncbi:hypothetical protein [Prevotella koreensis]